MKKKFGIRLLTLALAATMILSGCNKTESSTSTPSGSEPSSSTVESSGGNTSDPEEEIVGEDTFLLEKIDDAQKRNSDVKGWLTIPNTTISDPVLQAKDNDYYLRLNEDKKYDVFGCYYADFENVLSTRDKLTKNTIVYGHSDLKDNKDGKKFSQLFKFVDLDFVKNNPYIYFSTEEEDMQWEVFSVFFTHKDFYYIESNPNTTEFNKIISEAKDRSQFIINTPVSDTDKILTLSTCSANYKPGDKENYRLVVMAKLVPSGSKLKTELAVTANPNPKKS